MLKAYFVLTFYCSIYCTVQHHRILLYKYDAIEINKHLHLLFSPYYSDCSPFTTPTVLPLPYYAHCSPLTTLTVPPIQPHYSPLITTTVLPVLPRQFCPYYPHCSTLTTSTVLPLLPLLTHCSPLITPVFSCSIPCYLSL